MARLKRPLAQAPPRQRILHAARDLFYREGINAVSVEAIAATAGTNKMTLYRHFSSRDELVAAYLTELAAEGEGVWEVARAAHPGDPDAQLLRLRAIAVAAEALVELAVFKGLNFDDAHLLDIARKRHLNVSWWIENGITGNTNAASGPSRPH